MRNPTIMKVVVFSPEKFLLKCEYEQYTWNDIIKYKVFYPLLEKIDNSYLIIMNELLRTSKRNDLTYNCLHHYLNQTPHRIVFQWFPLIDDIKDFMILADNIYPERYKGRGFTADIIDDFDIKCIDRRPEISVIDVNVPDGAMEVYIQERDKLFDTLGNKDPDTIPRQLHLWCGKWKKGSVRTDKKYLARNRRFKMSNISTYKDSHDTGRVSIDLPHRRIELNDYLYESQAKKIEFLSTPFKVDKYYVKELFNWNDMVGEFYAQTSIRSAKCSRSGN